VNIIPIIFTKYFSQAVYLDIVLLSVNKTRNIKMNNKKRTRNYPTKKGSGRRDLWNDWQFWRPARNLWSLWKPFHSLIC